MKKIIFMDELKQNIKDESLENLKDLILIMAESIPKESYPKVLVDLNKTTSESSELPNLNQLMKELLDEIDSGIFKLTWEVTYSDYEFDYHDHDYYQDEIIYLCDHNNLGVKFEHVLNIAIKYIQMNLYSDAALAFKSLFDITEISDCEIEMSDLFSNDIIDLDYDEVLLYYAYASLMALKDEARIKILSEILSLSNNKLKLDVVTKVGDTEIPEFRYFIKGWQRYLLTRKDFDVTNLLVDALLLDNGTESLKEFVLKDGHKYQKSFISLINIYISEENYDAAIEIALFGLEKIKGIHGTRLSIASILKDLGEIKIDKHLIETGIIESFKSSPELKYYIPLHQLNQNKLIEQALILLEKKKDEDYFIIKFINGDYDLVWNTYYHNHTNGIFLPLFIALLDGSQLNDNLKSLISAELFLQEISFNEFFTIIENSFKKISEKDYLKYFDCCKKEISDFASYILSNQIRNSYIKVSRLVVAMAEVLLNNDTVENAINYLKAYESKYLKYNKFRKELKNSLKNSSFNIYLDKNDKWKE